MRKPLLALLLLVLAASWLLATTYSQPFAVGHGFTWATTSGSCDTSLTAADDTAHGSPVNSIYAECIGRNDSPLGRWKKSMTWESMGVTAGNTVTQVDGKYDHAIITRTYTSAPVRGPLSIYDSGDSSQCMASNLEAGGTYSSGTGGTSWATDNASGAIATLSACQASNTTVTVRTELSPKTGNNSAATTRVNIDNVVLTITEVTPSGRKSQVIVVFNSQGDHIRRSFSETLSFSSDTNNGRAMPNISLLRPLLYWWKEYFDQVFS